MAYSNVSAVKDALDFALVGVTAADAEKKLKDLNGGTLPRTSDFSGLDRHLANATLLLHGMYLSKRADEVALPLVTVAHRMFARNVTLTALALSVCDSVIGASPQFTAPRQAALQLLSYVANSSISHGKYGQATRLFTQLASKSPIDSSTHHDAVRCLVWLRLGDHTWEPARKNRRGEKALRALAKFGYPGSPEQLYGHQLLKEGDTPAIKPLHVNEVSDAYRVRTGDRDQREKLVAGFMSALKA